MATVQFWTASTRRLPCPSHCRSPAMRPDLQLALIGYGLAGRVFHAPLIQHTPGLALHSIVSSQRDTLLRTFSDVHVRATPQQVFDDPAVDAVVIATPNEKHAPLAIGPHPRDQMLVLFGWPEAIDADLAVQREGGGGIDYFHAILHYPRHRAI